MVQTTHAKINAIHCTVSIYQEKGNEEEETESERIEMIKSCRVDVWMLYALHKMESVDRQSPKSGELWKHKK